MSTSVYEDKIDRVSVYIDSKNRASGTNENFVVTLSEPVERVKNIDVVSIEIPFTFYVVNSSTNTLAFTVGATPYTITVTPGNYDVITFTQLLQQLMVAAVAGFSVSYSSSSYKLTFSNASSFELKYSTSTIAPIIGLTADSGAGTSFTCQATINLSGPNYVFVKSTVLVQPKVRKPFAESKEDTILYKSQIPTGPGSTLLEKNLFPVPIRYGTRQRIQTFDLSLTDPDGTVLDLNGQRWSMTLVLSVL